jgi:RNA polymerase sigma factor (sigma-70 family)
MPTREFANQYAAARSGDRAAQQDLLEGLRPRLKRYIDRHMGAQVRRRVEPDDVYQTVVLTFLSRLERFPDDLVEEEVLAYALQIAKWRIADVLKGGSREQGESVLPRSEIEDQQPSTGPVTRKDDQGWTREKIQGLPGKYSGVLWCYYVEGKSMHDIADELGIATDLVRQRLARGRRLLKEGLRGGD